MPNKKIKERQAKAQKRLAEERKSSDGQYSVWYFSKIDRNGPYAFDTNRSDFNHALVLEKIIAYSNMTWQEIKQQTHDKGRSKHHMLSAISKEAEDRLNAMGLNEYSDSIFSFALTNMIRVVGIREDEKFFVLWYDPEHRICPSTR